jgi:hypothetical protein
LPVAQSTVRPSFETQPSVDGTTSPVSNTRSVTLSEVTPRTISLKRTSTGPLTPGGTESVAVGGVVSGEGIVTASNVNPLNQSESTHPWMPGTEPQLLCCQKVQP